MTTRFSDDPPLDALLDASRPATPLADAMTDAAAGAAVEAARRRARSTRPALRRGVRPVLAVTTVLALGAVGAGAAAAVATHFEWTAPWAEDPDVVFTYALPSGAVCEERIGGVDGTDPEVREAARDFFRSNDVLALADVDAALDSLRHDDNSVVLPSGEVVDAPYGSEHYPWTPDSEYRMAVSRAVGEVFAAELERRGVELGADGAYDSYEGESQCPGAQW